MISDAFVRVTCDGYGCRHEEELELPVMYSNYSGTDPHADLRDAALNKVVKRAKWIVTADKHYCTSECAPAAAPEETKQP